MLLVAGDLDTLDLDELGEAAFAGTAGRAAAGRTPLGVPVRDRRRVILVDRPGSVQSTLRIGHRAPERATPDYVPMTLAATVLGGAFTSRLNHLIREVKGYTYGIRGSYAMTRRFGRFEVARRRADRGDRAGHHRHARRDRPHAAGRGDRGGAGGGPLVAGRPAVGGDADAGRDRRRAEHAGRCTACPDDYYATLRRDYLEATVEQVSAAAAEHLHPDGLTLVVEGDAAVIRDELVAADFGELVDADL